MVTGSELVSAIYLNVLYRKLTSYTIGPNELSIANANAISAILGPNGMPKGPRESSRV